MALRAEHSWMEEYIVTASSVWTAIAPATVSFVSEGGPLLINLDLFIFADGGQTFGCRPMLDGIWAGDYGQYPKTALWTEGLNYSPYGWNQWSKSRVYRGVPAGQHTLTIECVKDTTTPMQVGHAVVPQSVSVLEMH
jgi:hypothetical protein